MKKFLFTVSALLPALLAAPQAQAGVVFAWDDGFDACHSSCSVSAAGPLGNLSEAVQGYAGISTFDGTFMRSDQMITITASNLPTHNFLDLDFLLAIIDSWDGSNTSVAPDSFNVEVDGTLIYSETYDQFDTADQTASTSNQLSFGSHLGFAGWTDSAYDMGGLSAFTNIAHSASSVTIKFFADGAGWQGGADENFALEDVTITARVDAPAALGLLAFGLGGLALARRRIRS